METFSRALARFKTRLSSPDIIDFELTTFEDLKVAIDDIQRDQAQRHALRNLNKIKPFIRCLQQYAGVIEQFVTAKPDFLAFIWFSHSSVYSTSSKAYLLIRDPSNYVFRYVSFRFAVFMTADRYQIASRVTEAFDSLLDAYARIGEALPVFAAIDGLFTRLDHHHGHVEQILANVYEDILSFHKRAIVFFRQRGRWL